jgi:hypothetical protein
MQNDGAAVDFARKGCQPGIGGPLGHPRHGQLESLERAGRSSGLREVVRSSSSRHVGVNCANRMLWACVSSSSAQPGCRCGRPADAAALRPFLVQGVGREETVGPFLGELEGPAEHDRDCGPADVQLGEPVGDHGGRTWLSLNSCEYRPSTTTATRGQGGDLGRFRPVRRDDQPVIATQQYRLTVGLPCASTDDRQFRGPVRAGSGCARSGGAASRQVSRFVALLR